MNMLNLQLLAVNRDNMFRNMGEGFRDKRENFNPAELLLWALVLIGAFVVLNLLSQFLSRRDKRRFYHSPRALFRALCRTHELDRGSRRLLKQLAAYHRLPMAAQIFLQPDLFDPARLSPSLQSHEKRLLTLQRQLFGTVQRPLSESSVHSLALEIALEASQAAQAASSGHVDTAHAPVVHRG